VGGSSPTSTVALVVKVAMWWTWADGLGPRRLAQGWYFARRPLPVDWPRPAVVNLSQTPGDGET